MVKNSPSKLEGAPEGEGVCLAAKNNKNSPSKLEGAPEGEGVCLAPKSHFATKKLSL